ncbi:hypothetical protein [Rhodopirellula bahusiensis]
MAAICGAGGLEGYAGFSGGPGVNTLVPDMIAPFQLFLHGPPLI